MARPSPWDASGTANSLADAIRRQADAQAAQAQAASGRVPTGNNSPAPNPLDQLMQQIQSISVPETPYDVLMGQAQSQAGAQFDPLIEQLKSQMGATKKRAAKNQGTAKAMYNDLATDIAGQLPEITNQMAAATRETEQRYNDTQAALAQQYNKQSQEQAQLLKQLGIEAAIPGASQQAKEDQAYFQNQSQLDEQSALQALKEMTASDVSYNRQSADNTRLAGVNAAQDIGMQLEDYLGQAQGQLTGLEAQRSGAIQSLLAQLQQADAQRVQSSEQQQYKQLMDMFNMGLKLQELAQKNPLNGDQLFKGTNGPSGAANLLGEVYGNDTTTSNMLMSAISDVMNSPDAVAGKYASPDLKDSYGKPMTMDTTPEYLADLLRRRLAEGDLDPNTPANQLGNPQFSDQDINAAIQALYAYLGKAK